MEFSSFFVLERAVQILWQTIQIEKQRWYRTYSMENFRGNQYAASSAASTGNSLNTCTYCDKRGHLSEDCRRRKKACFRCGATSHLIRACPLEAEWRDSASSKITGQTCKYRPDTHRASGRPSVSAVSTDCKIFKLPANQRGEAENIEKPLKLKDSACSKKVENNCEATSAENLQCVRKVTRSVVNNAKEAIQIGTILV